MVRKIDLTGRKFGRLTALEPTSERYRGNVIWKCQCSCKDATIVYRPTSSLLDGDINSCGCLKREQDKKNLKRKTEGYDHLKEAFQAQKIDGIAVQMFTTEPNKNNGTGYKGVSRKSDGSYYARIKIRGKTYYKGGFKTAEEAFYKGRIELEKEHLPIEKVKKLEEERKKDGI